MENEEKKNQVNIPEDSSKYKFDPTPEQEFEFELSELENDYEVYNLIQKGSKIGNKRGT